MDGGSEDGLIAAVGIEVGNRRSERTVEGGVITINRILLRFAFHGERASFGIKKIKTERRRGGVRVSPRWTSRQRPCASVK